ncbi:MAG: hypothetical protein RL344_347 [Pseudomonadota bacterium]|jgi:hypothetical protein
MFKNKLKQLLCLAAIGVFNISYAADCMGKLLPTSPVTWMGEFEHFRYTEEHQYGESIELWRSDACVFGIFISMAGLQGDPPRAVIKNGTFDSKTGYLSFNAVLRRITSLPDSVNKLSKATFDEEWFTVKGVLTKRIFRGTVQNNSSEYYVSPEIASKKTVHLKRDYSSYHEDKKYVNYGQSKVAIEELLKKGVDF